MTSCLNCKSPLGSQTVLCYSCQSDGVELPDADKDVVDRIERYCLVASVRCSDCGDIHGKVRYNGRDYTAEDFGIESEEDWEIEMDKEEEWISKNQRDVQRALLEIEDEWPKTVRMIRRFHL